jgi:membrane fusion protein, multidrug efflux system
VSVDAYPDMTLEGGIESFTPGSGAQFSLPPPDNAIGNFTEIVQRVPVRIALPADDLLTGLLRPGLSEPVTVDIRDDTDGNGLVGSAQANSSPSTTTR